MRWTAAKRMAAVPRAALHWSVDRAEGRLGSALSSVLPVQVRRALLDRIAADSPHEMLQSLGPRLNRRPDLDSMAFDLAPNGSVGFEHLAGLFSSTTLDHAVISMTVRQAAYLYGLVRSMKAQRVIEVGRYKGGSTLVIACAMGAQGRFWSIDIGEKEARLRSQSRRSFDEQLHDIIQRMGLKAELLVGDSRTLAIETGTVDLVLIDGDHSYEGVKSDFDRFGRRVRVGGAVLLDDTFDEDMFKTHSDSVGRLAREILDEGDFKLARAVNRMAHLERVR